MSKHILIVEDDMVSFIVGKGLFETADCDIEHAPTGEKALELFSQNSYDGVYMDLGLPKMTGLETCRAMRNYEEEHKKTTTPIIAITANDNPSITKDCLAAGMMDVLFKPLDTEKVARFLKTCGL